MNISCAWCKTTLVFSKELNAPTSHTICKPCKANFERELAWQRSPQYDDSLVNQETDSFIDQVTCEEYFV